MGKIGDSSPRQAPPAFSFALSQERRLFISSGKLRGRLGPLLTGLCLACALVFWLA
jgi:hypothetical protein